MTLSKSEIRLIFLAGCVIAAAGLWSFVLKPIAERQIQAQSEVQRLDQLDLRLAAIEPSDISAPSAPRRPLLERVAESASTFGLAPDQLIPEQGGLRVVIADAAFADTLRWLKSLTETDNTRIRAAKFSRQVRPGRIDVSLVLEDA